ncbi:MAG: hypothetical protein U5L96_03610 [Owenweeksia sp.]|nr:hypothetical protein [Owenweeksia sp.]
MALMNGGVNWVEQQAFMLIQAIHITRLEMVLLYIMIIAGFSWLFFGGFRKLIFSLGALVLFAGSQLTEQMFLHSQPQLVAYATRGHTALGMYSPQGSMFLADTSLLEDDDALTFHVKHHWWARDVSRPRLIKMHENVNEVFIIKKGPLIRFGQWNLFLFERKNTDPPPVGTWIVTANVKPPQDFLHTPDIVVLSGAIDYYSQLAWKDWCDYHQIKFWNTSVRGAWQISTKGTESTMNWVFN